MLALRRQHSDPVHADEYALARAPVTVAGEIALNTNEEARVIEIERDVLRHEIEICDGLLAWAITYLTQWTAPPRVSP